MRILFFMSLLLASVGGWAAEKASAVFTLDHQMSVHCENKIKSNLRFEKGVKSIAVSLKANTITVGYDPATTDPAKIIDGFRKIGFKAMQVEDSAADNKSKGPSDKKNK